MEHLPPELITRILSFLDPISVTKSRQVCRRWWIISTRLTNPLYLPLIMRRVMRELGFRDAVKLRLICKLWKDGLDKLTSSELITLKGRTDFQSCDPSSLVHQWNPFPSRIVRMETCQCPNNNPNYEYNGREDILMERYGDQIHYLQVFLQSSTHVEQHFKRMTKFLKNIRGLVVSEAPPKFWEQSANQESQDVVENLSLPPETISKLSNLKFLKLDDCESKLKYIELYREIILNSPSLNHLDIHGYYHLHMDIVKLIPRLSNLTILKIDIEDPYTEQVLELLDRSNFRLKSFSTQLNGWGDEDVCKKCATLLHNSLEQYSETLVELELKLNWDCIGGVNFEPEILHFFPSSKGLVRLKKLKLVGYLGQLSCLQDMVSLQSLLLINYDPEVQQTFKSEDSFYKFLPKLKTLYLPQHTISFESSSLRNEMRDFMLDDSYDAKYCGLYSLGFP